MGRKPGVQSIPKGEAQAKVLALLEQGSTITAAMAAVGRNDTTFRQWSMVDEAFKEKGAKMATCCYDLRTRRPKACPD